jgi:hypothetical protein
MMRNKIIGYIAWDQGAYETLQKEYGPHWWQHMTLPKLYNMSSQCESDLKPGQIVQPIFVQIKEPDYVK